MIDLHNRPRTAIQYLRLYFTGVAMGIADIIPGVSGGTMAFILGIYEDLVNGIKSINIRVMKLILQLKLRAAMGHVPWQFLLAVGLGILTAVFSLANLLSWLLDNQPVFLYAFFFGLILASILAISMKIEWSLITLSMLAIGALAAYLIIGMVPLNMPHDPLTLFLSGTVAIMAMILPGISGAFILLILGQYAFVLNAVKTLDIVSILAVAAGAVIGITSFSRILSWMLRYYEQATLAVLVGFIVGSLRKIWPWKVTLETMVDRHGDIVPIRQANVLPDFTSTQFWVALGLCLIGFLVISFLDHLQTKSNPLFRLVAGRRNVDIATAE